MKTLTVLCLAAFTLLSLLSCSIHKIRQQSIYLNEAAEIKGKVKVASSSHGTAIALLFRKESDNILSLSNQFTLSGNGEYIFHTPAGEYVVAAFLDSSGDGEYQEGEHATYQGIENGEPLFIKVGEKSSITVKTLAIEKAIANKGKYTITLNPSKRNQNIGQLASLENQIFSDKFASMGLWRPIDFITQVGGGLYLLDHYDAKKTPILFVHGMNGSARNWSYIIQELDTKRFQPFVLYYPSGVRLDMVSDYIVKAINTLYAKYRFEKFYIVAHSMGGLVSRSFIMKHYQSKHPAKIKLFVTINSPMLGMSSANMGVLFSPIVVPSWRDIASQSKFIKRIHEWQWPKEIPYHLIFSYRSGKGDDGVVPLESQIPIKLQLEATRIYGFNASHTKLLHEKRLMSQIEKILNDTRSKDDLAVSEPRSILD